MLFIAAINVSHNQATETKFSGPAIFYIHWHLDMVTTALFSLWKTVGKVPPILVTLTSRNDSDFESSNVSLKENKPDGVNPNSNDIDYYVRKNEGKILWFPADCITKVECGCMSSQTVAISATCSRS